MVHNMRVDGFWGSSLFGNWFWDLWFFWQYMVLGSLIMGSDIHAPIFTSHNTLSFFCRIELIEKNVNKDVWVKKSVNSTTP